MNYLDTNGKEITIGSRVWFEEFEWQVHGLDNAKGMVVLKWGERTTRANPQKMELFTKTKRVVKTHHREQFTQWDFIIVSHYAQKVKSEGESLSTIWKCTVTLETEQPVNNEVEAQRDIEVLLMMGYIPHFGGTIPSLRDIGFQWDTRSRKVPSGENFEIEFYSVCAVTLTYMSSIDTITTDETRERLEQMYGENYLEHLHSPKDSPNK